MSLDDSEELVHHGVKGQKWGVRKRRPTGNGRSRVHKEEAAKMRRALSKGLSSVKSGASKGYQVVSAFASRKVSSVVEHRREKKMRKQLRKQNSKVFRKKNLKKMTDEELNRQINRIKKESEYMELTKTGSERIKSAIGKTLKSAASQALTAVVGATITNAVKAYKVEKELSDLDDLEKKLRSGGYKKVTASDLKKINERKSEYKRFKDITKSLSDHKMPLKELMKKDPSEISDGDMEYAMKRIKWEQNWDDYVHDRPLTYGGGGKKRGNA